MITAVRRLKTYLAQRELQRITDARANSFETQLYRKNRAAQLQRREREAGTSAPKTRLITLTE